MHQSKSDGFVGVFCKSMQKLFYKHQAELVGDASKRGKAGEDHPVLWEGIA
jgi:hypothetical protein